jgi:hypothetical protein
MQPTLCRCARPQEPRDTFLVHSFVPAAVLGWEPRSGSALEGAEELGALKSVSQLSTEKGEAPSPRTRPSSRRTWSGWARRG